MNVTSRIFDNDSYTYGYDTRGRLKKATTSEYSDDFSENYTRDVRSNIKLTRTYRGDGRVRDNGVGKYPLYPEGYYKGGSYYRYIRDYQGNTVAVLNSSGGLVQSTDYYPYGEPWLEPEGQPWLYSGNERLRMDGINEYDFNARRYNSVLGCFTTWDPLCEKYPWLSPYSYCGGDPVNAIDKDGKLIIFINGMHFGDGGSKKYWGSFLNAFAKPVGDHRVVFYDGACGGMAGLASNRRGVSNHTAKGRYLAGKEKGRNEAEKIFSFLIRVEGKQLIRLLAKVSEPIAAYSRQEQ